MKMKEKLIIFLLITLVFISGCGTKEPEVICQITDIIQVSPGGFGTEDKCLYETTCGKLNIGGFYNCKKQIGDYVIKPK